MAWLELRLNIDSEHAEYLEDSLIATGASAVTYTDAGNQSIFELAPSTAPPWSQVALTALYQEDTDTDEVLACLEASYTHSLPTIQWSTLEDRVWEREWLEHHEPALFGNCFWVYHEQIEGDVPTLLLDPGLAFGTGSHPTTALCLEWIAQHNWQNKTAVDYGCGSGILGIATALLGCNHVQCIDTDPQAITATLDNFSKNRLEPNCFEVCLAGEEAEYPADILLANILAGPLLQLGAQLASRIKPGGQICLSGILHSQRGEILDTYAAWFDDIKVGGQDEWLRVTGRRMDTDGI